MLRIRGSSHPIAPLGAMAMVVAFMVRFVTHARAAKPQPDTVIDTGPATSTSSTGALSSFQGGTAASGSSPLIYSCLGA
jgi:hypothetical protein